MSKKKRTVRRVLFTVLGVAVALILVAALAVVVVLRGPLPKHSGEVTLSGPRAEIRVLRDDRAVPHIYATTDHDLFFAQGYVHAQERFFQMDLSRHMASGRLAELVGESGKESDITVRTMGLRRVAEQEWDLLSAEARGFYEAYAEGINAYISGKQPWQLANEYAVLGLSMPVADIEPWTGIDSLVSLKQLNSGLSNTHTSEIDRMGYLQKLGSPAAVEELFPRFEEEKRRPIIGQETTGSNLRPRADYPVAEPLPLETRETNPEDCPEPSPQPDRIASQSPGTGGETPSLSSGDAIGALQSVQRAMEAAPHLLGDGPGIGSNSFAISGQHTASGKPIIGNDPHLQIAYPSVWFQVGLHCEQLNGECTFDVSGFSMAGLPGVMIGRNADLAWGLTNLGGDVSDLVVEKNVGENSYQRDGRCLAYQTRTETIRVAGGEDVEIRVRTSVHGPVVSGLFAPDEQFRPVPGASENLSVALQWTALMPGRTGESFIALSRARNAEEVSAAAALMEAPAENILFATASGDIGYQAPGRYPVRPVKALADGRDGVAHEADNLGADGRWPRPGWDSSYDWQGFYAPSDMPAVLNPADGIIVPANQPATPEASGPYLGTAFYVQGYRSQQMYDAIAQLTVQGPVTLEEASKIMLLDGSPQAQELAPALTTVELSDERHKELQSELALWYERGGHYAVDEPGAMIMASLFSHLGNAALADDGVEYPEIRLMGKLISEPQNPLWDDKNTPEVEDAAQIMRRAYAETDAELTARLGRDHTAWRWGDLHVQTPRHQILGGEGLPWFIRDHFSRKPRAVGGGPEIPNANGYDESVKENGQVDYEVVWGPSMRMAVDLSDVDRARWVISSGSSGHPWSSHVADQFEAWATGEFFDWPFSREAVAAATRDTLTLRPE